MKTIFEKNKTTIGRFFLINTERTGVLILCTEEKNFIFLYSKNANPASTHTHACVRFVCSGGVSAVKGCSISVSRRVYYVQ